MGPTAATETFVGRHGDVALLGRLLREVVAGRGQSALVEGDPGIGKSALLAVGLRTARDLGCEVFWAAADELGQPFPLRAVLDCLDVIGRAEDPWRAGIIRLLRQEHSPGVTGTGDAVLGAAEQLLALVDRACETKPVLMVLDDMQWADSASLHVWHRLSRATEQLPLLLVGAYRPVPRRTELDQLRRSFSARGGVQLELSRLAADEVSELIAVRTGGREVGAELTR
ncbi:AAA family ATPase, partial [Kutzneria sp. 744]|uniref:AAA family ATPase n=1 Tax=Kutzneria sp. (strain 744) TaxID=345341 RepID=UPI0012F87D62